MHVLNSLMSERRKKEKTTMMHVKTCRKFCTLLLTHKFGHRTTEKWLVFPLIGKCTVTGEREGRGRAEGKGREREGSTVGKRGQQGEPESAWLWRTVVHRYQWKVRIARSLDSFNAMLSPEKWLWELWSWGGLFLTLHSNHHSDSSCV